MMYESNIKKEKDGDFAIIDPIVQFCNFIEVEDETYWGWRLIPDHELILIVEGRFTYQTRQETFEARKGDIICIPPLVEHYLAHLPQHGKGVISCIHNHPFEPLNSSEDQRLYPFNQAVTCVAEDFDYFEGLFRFAAKNFGFMDDQTAMLEKSIIKTIWLSLMKYWQEPCRTRKLSETMVAIVRWIRDNLNQRISRSDIAEEFCYSPEYINFLFKKELGVTTSQFINREKVLYGFRLIGQDGMSVKQAAAKLGFIDQYHFSKVFKKITGINPSQYKR